MSNEKTSRWTALWILPPILIGIALFMISVSGKQPPAKVENVEPARAVRYVEATRLDLVPIAQGYGAVQPARTWSAVAQVSGRVVFAHPRLHDREIIDAGEVLLEIDPVDYELALAQAEAELTELQMQAQNAQASLSIEKRNLKLAQREMARMEKLAKQGTASHSDADTAERTMLSTRTAVQNLENTLALIPSQRAVQEARIQQARRDIEHSKLIAPFNLRVDKLSVEKDQFVNVGQVLFEGDDIQRVEIDAQVALSAMRRLFIERDMRIDDPEQLNAMLTDRVGFHPRVRLDLGDFSAEWKAVFVRFGASVDATTRSMSIVVAVDNPFGKVIPGYRPPLSKGMFTQVLLAGNPQPNRLIVPRNAVRDGAVYVISDDDRLQRRPVELLFEQADVAVIKSGVQAGDRVVVSDLVPAVEGMLLIPSHDDALQADLLATRNQGKEDKS